MLPERSRVNRVFPVALAFILTLCCAGCAGESKPSSGTTPSSTPSATNSSGLDTNLGVLRVKAENLLENAFISRTLKPPPEFYISTRGRQIRPASYVFTPKPGKDHLTVAASCYLPNAEETISEVKVYQNGKDLVSLGVTCSKDIFYGVNEPKAFFPNEGDVKVVISHPEYTALRVTYLPYKDPENVEKLNPQEGTP